MNRYNACLKLANNCIALAVAMLLWLRAIEVVR
jgi:hypothetical protein